MKVICRKAISSATGKDLGNESPWVKIGKEYPVLAMFISERRGPAICLVSENDNQPTFRPLAGFEIVDQTIPSSWVPIFCESEGDAYYRYLLMAPASWRGDDYEFLEKLHDRDSEAFELYLQEAPKIYEEAGCELPLDFPEVEPEPDPKVERLKELFGEDWDKWDYLGEEGADQAKGEKP